MKSIIPAYILIIGFTILVMTGISLVSVQAQITSARDIHTSCLNQIQASSYDEETIKTIKSDIEDRYGWNLDVKKETVFKDRKAMRITLNYTISVPFMNIPDKAARITAYGK